MNSEKQDYLDYKYTVKGQIQENKGVEYLLKKAARNVRGGENSSEELKYVPWT